MKGLEHTKTEEALQLAVKEHDLWMYQNEEEGVPGKNVDNDEKEPYLRGMWTYFSKEDRRQRSFDSWLTKKSRRTWNKCNVAMIRISMNQ